MLFGVSLCIRVPTRQLSVRTRSMQTAGEVITAVRSNFRSPPGVVAFAMAGTCGLLSVLLTGKRTQVVTSCRVRGQRATIGRYDSGLRLCSWDERDRLESRSQRLIDDSVKKICPGATCHCTASVQDAPTDRSSDGRSLLGSTFGEVCWLCHGDFLRD